MRFSLLMILLVTAGHSYTFAQLKTAPDGGNKKAWVGEQIGITEVHVTYDRPGVKGREGKIWGQLVPYGFTDPGFGTSKQAPWRAGANENTVISFSTDVLVEGQSLKAGNYGFHIAVYADKCTLIFSNNHTSWGSFFYDPKEDALRVEVIQQKEQPFTEYLQYKFSDQTDSSAVLNLLWEKWRIPVTVSVNLVETQLASFRQELRGEKSFSPGWPSWQQAADYCLQNGTNLEEGLQWANTSISGVFIGQANFVTLRTKAGLLEKLGRQEEAATTLNQALELGTVKQLHQYAAQLMAAKQTEAAFGVFKKNYERFPDAFLANMGMARTYLLKGDGKKAGAFAEKSIKLAPDEASRQKAGNLLKEIRSGKAGAGKG